MDILDAYYSTQFGFYPFDDETYLDQTRKTVMYLLANNISEKDLHRVFEEVYPEPALTPQNLPDFLWEDSLLKRDTFYYSSDLQFRSGATVVGLDGVAKTEKFYLEMKIKFTIEDLLRYYYNKTGYSLALRDEKKDIGALNHLLEQYSRLGFIEAVDFILAMINEAAADEKDLTYTDIFALNNAYRAVTIEKLEQHTRMAKAYGHSEIVWR